MKKARQHPQSISGGASHPGAGIYPSPFRAVHAGISVLVFAVSLLAYLMTAAPTVSFWDSGEFITTAVIMGIPHPPGAPLLSLAGRLMSVIPFYDFRGAGFEHIAYRVNLIGVFTASFSALLLYLIFVHLIRKMFPLTGKIHRDFTVHIAGATAALTAAFSHQFWENAVEVETYMPSLLFSLLVLWLVLLWEERKDDPRSLRYLFLASFVIGLGNGIHLTVLLAAPMALIIVLAAYPRAFCETRLWYSIIPAAVAGALIRAYAGRGAFYFLMAIIALAGPVIAFYIARHNAARWRKILSAALVCVSLSVIGYSVQATIMIRAGKNPSVNEGAPDTWERYLAYLDREQYGQGTTGQMLRGAFERKAGFGYQFGYMYLRYLLEQFPRWGPSIPVIFRNKLSPDSPGQTVSLEDRVYFSPALWLLIFTGFVIHARKDPKRFGALLAWFLLTSVGLVLYLNMDNPQVRERDYFFIGSYQAVMLWLGMGIFVILRTARETLVRLRPRYATAATAATALIFSTIIPAAALTDPVEEGVSNWKLHNRSRDWIPLDYAVNILATCAPDAVLFTNGDNDTYPLWYAREVMGVRRDVSIVNMSLLNAPWYIKQLRDRNPKIPISFTNDYIDTELAGNTLSSQRSRFWDPEPREVAMAGITWKMPPSAVGTLPDGRRAGLLSVAAITLADIINTTNWSRPLYFAVTVSPDFMIGLFEHMSMEGMAFRLTKERAPDNEYLIDAAVLERNLFSEYRFRGLADSALYIYPDVRRMLRNYSLAFTRLSEQYLKENRVSDAIRATAESFRVYPPDPDIRMLLYTIFRDRGPREALDRLIGDELRRLPLHDVQACIEIGMLFLKFEMPDAASRVFRELSKAYDENAEVWRIYTAALFQAGDYRGALDTANRLRKLLPGDSQAEEMRRIIERKISQADSIAAKESP